MDVKTWLESTTLKFEDTAWKKPPAYPYGVYMDSTSNRGADDRLCIREHDLTIELYAETKTSLSEAESLLEALFITNAMAFVQISRAWIESERHWQSTYQLSFTEKF